MSMDTVTQLFFAHLWQGLLLIPVIFILNRFFAKKDSSLRHGLWFTSLGLLCVLPIMTFIDMPRLSNDWYPTSEKMEFIANQPTATVEAGSVPTVLSQAAPVQAGNDIKLFAEIATMSLMIIWALGAMIKLRLVARDVRHCRELEKSQNYEAFPRHLLPLNWPRHIDVLIADHIKVPMMVGFIKPRVLLPAGFLESIADKQLSSILFHELAHIERRDQWTALVVQMLGAVLWWSPWVFLVSNRMRLEREQACDDRAVHRTGSANSYATALIKGATQVAFDVGPKATPNMAPGVFHRQSELKERIMRITKKGYSPITVMSKPLVMTTILTLTAGIIAISFATPGVSNENQGENVDELFSRLNDDPIQRAFVESSARSAPEDLAKFLQVGADINGVALGDGTALMMAVRAGRMDNVEFLVGRGADVNKAARGDGNALILAVRNRDNDMINYLIDAGADVNGGVVGDGNPLIMAALGNDKATLQRLIDHGAKLDAIVRGDETALISAARANNLDAVHVLTEAGADVNLGVMALTIEGDVCRTPLGEALKNRNSAIADYLIDKGASNTDC